MLKVSDLRLKYPSGQRKIFDHLNITIQDKEKVLLLGPSGCGKSYTSECIKWYCS